MANRRSSGQQRVWYVYDWANSAFQTTVVTVFLGPYLTGLAAAAADVQGFVRPLGIPVRAAAYYPYLVSLSALLQIIAMPAVGAAADRTGRRRLLLGVLAYVGAIATISRCQMAESPAWRRPLRRSERRMRLPTVTRMAVPVSRSSTAMPAATHGAATANPMTPATAVSSATLTTMLLAGSGDVLIAARRPALTA
jgi:MFS family permease